MPTTDSIMLSLAHAGDDAAARWLWQAWGKRVRAYALVLGGNMDLADDVAQEVFLKVLALSEREVAQVREVGPFMLRMARNTLFNAVRGEGRLRKRQLASAREREHAADSALARATPAPTAALALGELAGWIARLDDDHRHVLALKHVAALTFDQIALALDTPRSTAASRYQAALAALRRLMESGVTDEPMPIERPAPRVPASAVPPAPPPARSNGIVLNGTPPTQPRAVPPPPSPIPPSSSSSSRPSPTSPRQTPPASPPRPSAGHIRKAASAPLEPGSDPFRRVHGRADIRRSDPS
ncbi:hypothetical protein BH11PLA1_BH11PLA1_03530 [soil metagenome]